MPKFNRKVEMDEDGVYETWTNRNGTEHFGNFTPFDDDGDDEESSSSCYSWCGNPAYPDCVDSCKMHDD